MSLCGDCKNEVRAITVYEGTLISCSEGILKGGYEVKECSHFEERPKDNSRDFDEAKQTANKGKPPRRQPKKIELSYVDPFGKGEDLEEYVCNCDCGCISKVIESDTKCINCYDHK